jgi:hypothetical protein
MKSKICISILFALLVSSALQAQIGVNVGCNFAKIGGLETGDMNDVGLANFSGGLFYDKDILPNLYLRVGAMYSPKGSYLKYADHGYSYYQKTFARYIEVPVQVKAKTGPFYALGGIYGAYAVNCNTKSGYKLKSGYFPVNDDEINLKKIDFGFKIGAGYQYKAGPFNIFFQGDYSLGLLNIAKNNGDPESGQNGKLRNKVFGLSAGMMINLF